MIRFLLNREIRVEERLDPNLTVLDYLRRHLGKTGTKEGYTKKATNARKTGTTIRWKPDLEVFTDINIPVDYYLDTLKRQAVVNSHIKFVLKNQVGSR